MPERLLSLFSPAGAAIVLLGSLSMVAPFSTAAAQDLSLEQAVERALSANPRVRAAAASVAASSSRITQARAAWLPRLDVIESWQRGDQPVYVFGSLLSQRRFTEAGFAIDALNDPDPISNHRAAISVQQMLFDGLRTQASVEAARIANDMTRAAETSVRADIALAVTEAYGNALLAASGRRAAEAAVASAEEDLRLAERRRDAGTGPEADVLSLRVHVAEMRARAIRMAADEELARSELNRLMGEPLDGRFELREVEPEPTDVEIDTAELEEIALRNRPEARQSALAVELAAANRKAARGSFLPSVSLQAAYEMNGHRFQTRASSWIVGAEMRWNVFAGGANLAKFRETAAAAARSAAEREESVSGIRLDVRNAAANLVAARARLEVGRAAVDQARESQRMIRDRYDAGMAAVNDVLRAAGALLDAEALSIGSLVELLVARAALDRAIGRSR